MSAGLDIAPEHLAEVRAILDTHLPLGVDVLVFGSRARVGAKRFLDIDLVLKENGPLDPRLTGRLANAFETSALHWRVDVVDLSTLSPGFLQAIRPDLTPLPRAPG